MPAQIRNSQMEQLLYGSMTTREEFVADGARLVSAVLATHRGTPVYPGGGNLIEGWLADSRQAYGEAAPVWTTVNIGLTDYGAYRRGAPYVDLDGATEYYSIADAAWQEAGANHIFTWRWVRLSTLAANQTIIGKWDTTGGNWRSWKLWYSTVAGAFRFTTNATGLGAADVHATSSYAEVVDEWYFVAGYFQPGLRQRIYVGAPTDAALTMDEFVVGISASVFNGGAALTMGASGDPADYLTGYISIGNTRFGPGYQGITAHAARLFNMTRWFYMTV